MCDFVDDIEPNDSAPAILTRLDDLDVIVHDINELANGKLSVYKILEGDALASFEVPHVHSVCIVCHVFKYTACRSP